MANHVRGYGIRREQILSGPQERLSGYYYYYMTSLALRFDIVKKFLGGDCATPENGDHVGVAAATAAFDPLAAAGGVHHTAD